MKLALVRCNEGSLNFDLACTSAVSDICGELGLSSIDYCNALRDDPAALAKRLEDLEE